MHATCVAGSCYLLTSEWVPKFYVLEWSNYAVFLVLATAYSVDLRSLVDETILNKMVAASKRRQTDDSSNDEYNRGAQMETVERALWLLVLLLAVGATHITNQKSLSK